MKQRFRLYRRKAGGKFYIHDGMTGKQESLGTSDRVEAQRLLHGRNEAERQPAVNLQIARAYLAASDPQVATRTWQFVMDQTANLKSGPTRQRWERAMKDKAFDSLRHLAILQTRAEHFLRVLESGTVCTNIFLRRLHNFALDMTWLPWPILPKKRWPQIHFKEKRGITWEEHQKVVAGGINAIRSDGRGGYSASLMLQYNFGRKTSFALDRAFESLQKAHLPFRFSQ